jgi:uncharacterized OsmC-like protein
VPDRSYEVRARSTNVFGRVLVSTRDQHLVADGPVQNGCPGEAITPAELFLGGVATCGVELVQVIARESGVAIGDVSASIEGTIPAERIRDDVSVFSKVILRFDLSGVGDEDAAALVEAFKGR